MAINHGGRASFDFSRRPISSSITIERLDPSRAGNKLPPSGAPKWSLQVCAHANPARDSTRKLRVAGWVGRRWAALLALSGDLRVYGRERVANEPPLVDGALRSDERASIRRAERAGQSEGRGRPGLGGAGRRRRPCRRWAGERQLILGWPAGRPINLSAAREWRQESVAICASRVLFFGKSGQ